MGQIGQMGQIGDRSDGSDRSDRSDGSILVGGRWVVFVKYEDRSEPINCFYLRQKSPGQSDGWAAGRREAVTCRAKNMGGVVGCVGMGVFGLVESSIRPIELSCH